MNQLTPKQSFNNNLRLWKEEKSTKFFQDDALHERFIEVLRTAVISNEKLMACEPASIFKAAESAARDNLLPDGIQSLIVPYNGKAKYQVCVQGKRILANRSSKVTALYTPQIVYKNDKFQYRPGVDEQPTFEPDWFGERGEKIGAFAVAKLVDGSFVTEVMGAQEIITRFKNPVIEKISSEYKLKECTWVKWEEEMWRKTVQGRLLKYLPKEDISRLGVETDPESEVKDVEEENVIELQENQTAIESRAANILEETQEPDWDAIEAENPINHPRFGDAK